jgi:hypothetical protein
MKIDLQVVDWATLVKQAERPGQVRRLHHGIGAFADPTPERRALVRLPGWHCNPRSTSSWIRCG